MTKTCCFDYSSMHWLQTTRQQNAATFPLGLLTKNKMLKNIAEWFIRYTSVRAEVVHRGNDDDRHGHWPFCHQKQPNQQWWVFSACTLVNKSLTLFETPAGENRPFIHDSCCMNPLPKKLLTTAKFREFSSTTCGLTKSRTKRIKRISIASYTKITVHHGRGGILFGKMDVTATNTSW